MHDQSGRKQFERRLDRIGNMLETGSGFICVLFFAAMTVVVLLGVFYRYVMKDPFQWSEEVARFLMLWLGFLAINIALRRDEHIGIDTVVKILPPAISKILGYLIYLMIGIFLIILLIKGYRMTTGTMMTAATMPISMRWIYMSVPVGVLLTFVQLLLKITGKILAEFEPVSNEAS